MIEIVLTDEKEVCWKFITTKDMKLDELILNIREQFYFNENKKQGDEK